MKWIQKHFSNIPATLILSLASLFAVCTILDSRALAQSLPEQAGAPPVESSENTSATKTTPTGETQSTESPTPTGLIDFDKDIRPILNAHCLECHGPKKASNDMRVDESELLLPYVEPGEVDASSLWTDYLVTADEEMKMPPVKHGNPLTGVELAAIRVWIEEGATWKDAVEPATAETPTEDSVPATSETPSAVDVPTVKASYSLLERLWEFQGYFHPAVVHFPVALLIMAAIFGLASLVYRESFEMAAFHCLWVGAVTSVFACLMGWSFADIRGYGGAWTIDWDAADSRHRWTGVALTSFALLVTLAAILSRRSSSRRLRTLWLVGTLISAALVGIVGHQGGEMTYGEGMFDRALENLIGKVQPADSLPANISSSNSTSREAQPVHNLVSQAPQPNEKS